MPRLYALAAAWLLAAPLAFPAQTTPADADWQTIQELASGPGTRFTGREEALAAAQQHLERQESTLRAFIAHYPDDPHRYSARIRLAGVLVARSKFLKQPALRAESQKILAEMEADPQTPASVKSDAGFEAQSEIMQDFTGRSDDEARGGIQVAVRKFDADFPGDRRFAAALVELATLYDERPAGKRALLEEAQTRTADPALRQRIDDDFRRLSQLGKPVEAVLKPWRGGPPIHLADRHGRAAVVLFWASWSAPSLRELARLEHAAPGLKDRPLDFYTVSLDDDPAALSGIIKVTGLNWLIHCDLRGWKGDLVRSLGMNALPTVWVLDRKGVLLTLNARDREEEWIDRALGD